MSPSPPRQRQETGRPPEGGGGRHPVAGWSDFPLSGSPGARAPCAVSPGPDAAFGGLF